MEIKPTKDRIFVKPDDIVEKTASGILLSDYSKKRPTSGVIIACGDSVDKEVFKVGTIVFYGEFSGQKYMISINGREKEEILIMTEKDINATEIKSNSNSPVL